MTDHHDAQDYTANGPTDVGFRTGGDGTGIQNGVVAAGTEIGVHGISRTALGVISADPIGIGVFGEGHIGVQGIGHEDEGSTAISIGVFGQGHIGVSASGDFDGVLGSSKAKGVRGIGDLVGVSGESTEGTGVHGKSTEGNGGQFESNKGMGLIGISTENRGGVFRTGGNVAQIRLEPIRQDTPFPILPQRGKVGDLILIRNTAMNQDQQVIDTSSLWLCIPRDPSTEDSDQWQQVLLGQKTTGTS